LNFAEVGTFKLEKVAEQVTARRPAPIHKHPLRVSSNCRSLSAPHWLVGNRFYFDTKLHHETVLEHGADRTVVFKVLSINAIHLGKIAGILQPHLAVDDIG
jgi:hypothetical protein